LRLKNKYKRDCLKVSEELSFYRLIALSPASKYFGLCVALFNLTFGLSLKVLEIKRLSSNGIVARIVYFS